MKAHIYGNEAQNIDIKQSSMRSKRDAREYTKKSKLKRLPKDLEEGTLEALKDLVAKQKQNMSAAAAATSSSLLLEASEKSSSINKIESSAQISQICNKLMKTLIHIDSKGIQETTFFLDGDAFKESVFEGAKITITEYSTAPKVFNIQFTSDPKALAVFEVHAADLMHTLQNEKLNFSVNRLDTSLMSEEEKHSLPKVERDLEKEEDA